MVPISRLAHGLTYRLYVNVTRRPLAASKFAVAVELHSLLVELNDQLVDVMLLCETWHDADSVAIRRLRADGARR